MPTDSRKLAYCRRERWLIRGIWAFQLVAGPVIGLLLAWGGYRIAIWIASLVVASGVDRTKVALPVMLLAGATILWPAIGRRGEQDD